MARVRIHITGVVQGVGFRPFVYREATARELAGWVLNASDGVHVEATGPRAALESFARALKAEAPTAARVDAVRVTWDDGVNAVPNMARFEIRASEADAARTTLVSPDIATCPDCLRELFDPADRRYHYPFINCTNCGPRFTIIRDLPYDRPATSMAAFPMCPDCAAEYADPADRRFHAQPDACFACGPHLTWRERATAVKPHAAATGNEVPAVGRTRKESDALIARCAEMLAGGGIVAVKGLGGFHLACNAADEAAVRELRRRKRRSNKPLAVMVPALADAKALCHVNEAERALLAGAVRPIVLLRRRAADSGAHTAPVPPTPPGAPGDADAVAPLPSLAPAVAFDLPELGVMLPYTPVQHLLLAACAERGVRALVMTSGNLSEEPIETDDALAWEHLVRTGIADALLGNDRAILSRYDDSVVRVAAGDARPVRRARGYAPQPLELPGAALLAAALPDAALPAAAPLTAGQPCAQEPSREQDLIPSVQPRNSLQNQGQGRVKLQPSAQPNGEGAANTCEKTARNGAQEAETPAWAGGGSRDAEAPARANSDARDTGALAQADGSAQKAEELTSPTSALLEVLACGAEQKATLAYTRERANGTAQCFLSQHIGDVENAGTMDAWHETRARFAQLFDLHANALACDAHPRYLSSQWARAEAEKRGLTLVEVQHHHAHVAAVIAEAACDGRVRADAHVIGVAFDGTGAGATYRAARDPLRNEASSARAENDVPLGAGTLEPDGTIWGGEVLVASLAGFERAAHLRPWRLPGGAASVRDARRNAFALLDACGLRDDPDAQGFLSTLEPETRSITATMLARNLNCPVTTSMGRLFDAVAALLGICPQATYEGEPAVALEAAAWRAAGAGNPSEKLARAAAVVFRNEELARFAGEATLGSPMTLDQAPIVRALLAARANGLGAELCALAFHEAVAQATCAAARCVGTRYGLRTAALSGGVFMNRLLLERVAALLEQAGLTVLVPHTVPVNDGCIAYGQAAVARTRLHYGAERHLLRP